MVRLQSLGTKTPCFSTQNEILLWNFYANFDQQTGVNYIPDKIMAACMIDFNIKTAGTIFDSVFLYR
jgi:hypothetical protein